MTTENLEKAQALVRSKEHYEQKINQIEDILREPKQEDITKPRKQWMTSMSVNVTNGHYNDQFSLPLDGTPRSKVLIESFLQTMLADYKRALKDVETEFSQL